MIAPRTRASHLEIGIIECAHPRKMASSGRGVRHAWRHNKRKGASRAAVSDSGTDLTEFFMSALEINRSDLTFNMDEPEDRERLATVLWNQSEAGLTASLTAYNPELAAVLGTLMQSSWSGRPEAATTDGRDSIRIEGLLTNLQRGQSQKLMPLLTVRLSCAALRAQLPSTMWRMVSLLSPGLLTSESWIESFVEFASSKRPPPKYALLKGVGAVMFDNYTRKVLYSSQSTVESHGYRLNMTNSASFAVPSLVAPPNFDADRLCAPHDRTSASMWYPLPYPCTAPPSAVPGLHPFRPINMGQFTSLFLISNPEILDTKRNRFTDYLKRTAAGTLFSRPDIHPPYVAHLDYHRPMWGVLQSSYEDVEAELNVLRKRHLDKRILFVGGDGLSIIRLNHLLKNHPDLYLDSAPMIIPVQGEAPHGIFHMMHGVWRLFRPFIRASADATLGPSLGRAVVDEPTVEHMNKATYALWWMTRACSEYLLLISSTAGAVDIDLVPEFLCACERNVDLAWVVHFLYDGAYLVLDCKQSVREGPEKSKRLDVLWREFYSIGHTGTANKTNYIPMSVMRVFWAEALRDELAQVYHQLRSIPMSLSAYVGWDTPIEWLNGAISDGVRTHVSEPRIEWFVQNYSLLSANYGELLRSLDMQRLHAAKMKDMDGNVSRMKHWLIENIGSDWATATRQNRNSMLGISSRGHLPWDEIRTAMTRQGSDSVPNHVSRIVRDLTSSFFAFG